MAGLGVGLGVGLAAGVVGVRSWRAGRRKSLLRRSPFGGVEAMVSPDSDPWFWAVGPILDRVIFERFFEPDRGSCDEGPACRPNRS